MPTSSKPLPATTPELLEYLLEHIPEPATITVDQLANEEKRLWYYARAERRRFVLELKTKWDREQERRDHG